MKVVVIGAGLGGVSAITGLRKANKNVEIVLIEPKDHCDFLKEAFAISLNENGWIEADEYVRVKNGGGKVFTIGDCSTFLPNSGYQSLDNAKTIGNNIKTTIDSLSKNKAVPDESLLTKGKASYQVILSTVGPSDGVFYTPAFYTQRFFPWIKNKTKFLFRVRMELGFKMKN